jgi:hypothetical protein
VFLVRLFVNFSHAISPFLCKPSFVY